MTETNGLTSLLSTIWEPQGFVTLTQIESVVEIIDEKAGLIMQVIKLEAGEYECVKLKKISGEKGWIPIKNKTKIVPELGEVEKWLKTEATIKDFHSKTS